MIEATIPQIIKHKLKLLEKSEQKGRHFFSHKLRPESIKLGQCMVLFKAKFSLEARADKVFPRSEANGKWCGKYNKFKQYELIKNKKKVTTFVVICHFMF